MHAGWYRGQKERAPISALGALSGEAAWLIPKVWVTLCQRNQSGEEWWHPCPWGQSGRKQHMLFGELWVAFAYCGKRFGGHMDREQMTNGLTWSAKNVGLYLENSDESVKRFKNGNEIILFASQRYLWWKGEEGIFTEKRKEDSDEQQL